MTNREQAIKRVAEAFDIHPKVVSVRLTRPEQERSFIEIHTIYAVHATERVLELEAALKRLIDDCCAGQTCDSNCTSDDCPFFRARQVLQPEGE